MHPLLVAQLSAAGLDVVGGGSVRRGWVALLREVSRTYEQHAVSTQIADRASPLLSSSEDDSPRDLIAEVDSSSSAPTPDERRSVEASPTEDAASFAPSAIADDVEPAILRDVLFSNLGGNLFVIKHILRKFVERSQATMTSLQQQSREEDWSALRREAHSLKGASGYVAAAQLNKRALALLLAAEEKKAGREPEPLIDFCLAQVGAEMQRVMLQIAVILEEEDAEG